MDRDKTILDINVLTGWRYPLRWHDERTSLGDFDGKDLTIEVFNISPEEQLDFLEKTWRIQFEVRNQCGRRPTFVFHSVEATEEHYQHLFPRIQGVVTEQSVLVEITTTKVVLVHDGPLMMAAA